MAAGQQVEVAVTRLEDMLGFQAITLTNFTDSAVPAIAAGSKIEVSGAFFDFDTESAVSGWSAISTAGTAYFQVIPSSIVSSGTLVASYSATAPVWSESKQGWYASAGSNTRVIGKVFKASTAGYAHKLLYKGREIATGLDASGYTVVELLKVVDSAGAKLRLFDSGGSADDKGAEFVVDGGTMTVRSITDSYAVRAANILTMDLGTGHIAASATPDGDAILMADGSALAADEHDPVIEARNGYLWSSLSGTAASPIGVRASYYGNFSGITEATIFAALAPYFPAAAGALTMRASGGAKDVSGGTAIYAISGIARLNATNIRFYGFRTDSGGVGTFDMNSTSEQTWNMSFTF